jgi:hypothetical protein
MPQRLPLITWLLLAATLAVDFVVLNAVAFDRYRAAGYMVVTFHTLIVSQLSLVCIWSALKAEPSVWTRLAPLFAVAITTTIAGSFMQLDEPHNGWGSFSAYLGYYGFHAVAVLAAMWFLQRTNYWQRRTGKSRTWQFSLFHVLTVTTVTAVLLALTRNNAFFSESRMWNVAFAVSYVALAVFCVVVWTFSWHWFFRLACALCVSLLLGIVAYGGFLEFGVLAVNPFNILHAHYLIEAVVLSIWLGLGPILPLGSDAGETRNEVPQAET